MRAWRCVVLGGCAAGRPGSAPGCLLPDLLLHHHIMTPHPAYHPPSLLHQSEAVQAISAEMDEEKKKKKKKDYGLLKALKAKLYVQMAYDKDIARIAGILQAAEDMHNYDLAEEIADELEKMENTTPEEHAAQVSTRVYTYYVPFKRFPYSVSPPSPSR